jgi:glycine hydroxymethyltransferase
MHAIAAKAVALREASEPAFQRYARAVVENAATLAATLAERGLRIVSGGTDNHLMLVDVGQKGLSGRDAERLCDKVGITVNRNTIPYDERPPLQGSGIRIGTPALTTRGIGPDEMRTVAGFIARTVDVREDEAALESLRTEVEEFAGSYPVPGITDRATVTA